MILLALPSHERMGEASLAPQGAAPAPPLQEGMGEATLAPQGAPPSAAVMAEDDPTQLPAQWRRRQQTSANQINNQQTTPSGGAGGRGTTGRRHDEGRGMHTTIKQIMRRGG